MRTVYTIGEALIDFIPAETGVPLHAVNSFSKAAGGAPANAACTVAKLGGRSSFIGKLGEDAFGDFLVETMRQTGVDTRCVSRTSEANTALAFVSLQNDGSRDFAFYRKPSADMLLNEADIEACRFEHGSLLHYGSVDLIEAPVKYAHIRAIESVKRAGGFISFDPNVRLPLWESAELCRQTILAFIPYSHLIKISDEELTFITGIREEAEAIASLFVGDVGNVLLTRGSRGATWFTKGGSSSVSVPGHRIKAIDTTGAGDSFIGALLFQLSRELNDPVRITKKRMHEILVFANAAAALTTTRNGAIPALPTNDEVAHFMEQAPFGTDE
ncbi:PfkB family carbohydrate kinase [Paenibacillus chondroitinus]|uniref:PfkB family carbohydrate kinase n=1 Tax=Paenibacillus chondroitinus TaxID=59842 RepID=A0ABU6DC82_9BACL|nr:MULTISPECIES: PfkB family carbohydrate kinase [Paenibacillus]MCY9660022.1 PfkB family carbohydrate kinase [Paenibacillus anseongense]MEB4795360.1 PfkB family carbohydrate kinase [Paenibacillus chondroitinus]